MGEIKTTEFIWMNGDLVRWNNAKVHVMTHALHYGSAVFEGIKSYKASKGTSIFRLDDHINRFFYSVNAMSMRLNITKKQIKDAIKKLLKLNKLNDAYIKPMAYYGYGNAGVFPKDIGTDMLIIAVPEYPYYAKNLRIITSSFVKHYDKSTIFGTKISGNYVNSVIAMYEARKKGFDEALMLDYKGCVAEGPLQNIFLVKNEALIAPISSSALLGITRDTIIHIGKDLGLKVYEKKVNLDQVKNADELFFCGTATEIGPIASVDDVKIGNGACGEVTSIIRNKYSEVVRGKDRKYIKWLTYI